MKKQRLMQILEGSKLGFWEWNVQSGDLLINDLWINILGYDLDEVKSDISSWVELVHHNDRNKLLKKINKLLKGESDLEFEEIEYRIQSKSGEWKWVSTRGKVIEKGDSGEVTVIAGTHSDITRRIKAEKQLKQINQELFALNTISQAMSRSNSLEDIASLLHSLFIETKAFPGGALYFNNIGETKIKRNMDWGLTKDILDFLPQLSVVSHYYEPQNDINLNAKIFQLINEIPSEINVEDYWKSCLAIPIISDQQMQGILFLFDTKYIEVNNHDQIFLKSIGQIIGVAYRKICLFEQVQDFSKQMQLLSQQLIYVQEQERKHLSRELHDQIGQLLTVLKINLQQINSQGYSEDNIEKSIDLVNNVLEDVKDLSFSLRPVLLDDLGLESALRWHLDKYAQHTGIHFNLNSNLGDIRFSSDLEISCYRIVQEAITNAIKHANPTKINIKIKYNNKHLKVLIQNDGQGFDVDLKLKEGVYQKSLGLIGMQERVALFGGELKIISSSLGDGTTVKVTFTVPPENKKRKGG
ncbi:hypothetical protein SYNTR_1230 [Candidatus Syntrophocurvum alkaliphilum]|uniref:histidine kinase n=1 Tax=Candidatus Syntrophocurvum alkaliphilum TaxID=2293317 RepID=A0A6I6DHS3_9FIRM|nr:PAS domain-containing protein [Candidatus Syntrophocurvum alkaliphilum]QGT99823.1 hypothetical protein SYNTR_1230 [Candidatus Syntrophocurvum alkaliphilum]